MSFPFNNNFENNILIENDFLSAFNEYPEKQREIKQGMSPMQIADIVSDHLMAIIRQQFEEVKKEFHSKENKK